MKLLLDENLAPRLASMLPSDFKGSKHVFEVEFGKKTDSNIWAFALSNGFAILTKDSDFAHRTMVDPRGPKIVWIRIGNCTTNEVLQLLLQYTNEILAFEQQNETLCLILERLRSTE